MWWMWRYEVAEVAPGLLLSPKDSRLVGHMVDVGEVARKLRSLPAALSALLVATTILTPAVHAAGICAGTVSGSPMRPIARPLVVSLEHSIDALANPELAQQFLDGMKSADVTIVPPGQAATTVDLSFVARGGAAGKPGAPSGRYRNLAWMRGSKAPGNLRATLSGANVDVTVYARDKVSGSLAWIGTITCKIQTDDVSALAEGLGEIVGRSLGLYIRKKSL